MITRILLSGLLLTSLVSADPPSEFFNGKDLTGWSGNDGFWSVRDGAIVGHSDQQVAKNEFIWSEVEVRDFHLAVDVRLTPDNRNAGIQFRSKKTDEHGQAHGYQADVGAGVWGKLYHEHGRGKLDWNNHAAEAVKLGEWNRYEILAVGDRIWTAINGTLCVSVRDPQGERAGLISFQIHSGPPQTVEYRNPVLTHDPPVRLAELNEAGLNAKLTVIGEAAVPAVPAKPRIKARETSASAGVDPSWTARIAAADPGSQEEAWAKPDFDDSAWETMKLPGHFENAGLPGFDGVVWFRKTIELTAELAKTENPTLGLGQIDDMDVTWVNGERVGGYEVPGHHYTVRNYPIAADVLQAGKNIISVRVMDHGWSGGIAGQPEQLVLRLGAHEISLADEWRMAAGANLAQLKAAKVIDASNPAAPDAEAPRFQDGFALEEGDVVAFIGGSGMVKQVESGALETFLTYAAGNIAVYFRDLAWQADTVFQRQRPRNFGTQLEALDRVNASVVVASFGQMEVMEGKERLPEFIAAYEAMLDEDVVPRTGKIVLVTPFPFVSQSDQPHIPYLLPHNEAVEAYAAEIVKLAKRRGWLAVDMSRFDASGLTTDGFQLTLDGHAKWAKAVTGQLLGEPGADLPPQWDAVHREIQKKNVLWRRHWRPTNWAFVYGNRQTQPSSKDHRPGKPRWFPLELEAIIPLIEQAEDEILELKSSANR